MRKAINGKISALLGETFGNFWDGLNHLLWPPVCASCRKTIPQSENFFCDDCWGKLMECTGGDYCPRCGNDVSKYAVLSSGCPHCQGEKIEFDGIARGGVYNGALRKMILDFKSADRTELADRLAVLADSALQGANFSRNIDMLVPVPLHWIRQFTRGYNQSLLIAKGLKNFPLPVSTDLVRTRFTRNQWTLNPSKRAANVADAFAVRPGHKFSGKNICLIDDIKTTGATLNECAKVLKLAGAVKVYALALAAAGQQFPDK